LVDRDGFVLPVAVKNLTLLDAILGIGDELVDVATDFARVERSLASGLVEFLVMRSGSPWKVDRFCGSAAKRRYLYSQSRMDAPSLSSVAA